MTLHLFLTIAAWLLVGYVLFLAGCFELDDDRRASSTYGQVSIGVTDLGTEDYDVAARGNQVANRVAFSRTGHSLTAESRFFLSVAKKKEARAARCCSRSVGAACHTESGSRDPSGHRPRFADVIPPGTRIHPLLPTH